MSRPLVRHAVGADEVAIAETLAQAFVADPVMLWLFPDESIQTEALRAFFAALTKAFRPTATRTSSTTSAPRSGHIPTSTPT